MKILDKLERWIRPLAIPNLTLFLIALQVFVYCLNLIRPGAVVGAYLIWSEVLNGQVWRLLTFLMIPPGGHPILLFFAWYIFYIMGSSLEVYWGTSKYNLFLMLGWLFTVAAAAFAPNMPASNAFLAGTVFLAFASYNPEFQLMLFFILPIKIKWLALLAWIGYGFSFLFGTNIDRLMVIASIGNYLIFFGKDIYQKYRYGQQRMRRRAEAVAAAKTPRHTCTTCGINSLTHPDMDFRYCSTCVGQHGYCTEHIRNHEHVTSDTPSS